MKANDNEDVLAPIHPSLPADIEQMSETTARESQRNVNIEATPAVGESQEAAEPSGGVGESQEAAESSGGVGESQEGAGSFLEVAAINQLPEEVLLKIFSFFPCRQLGSTIAVVCSHWHKLAMDPSLWELDFKHSPVCPEAILRITARALWVRKVRLPDRCVPLIIPAVVSWCSALTHLDVGVLHQDTDVEHIELMAENAVNVKHLRISSPLIDCAVMQTITSRMRFLTGLDVSFSANFSDDCVEILAKRLHVLHLLNIDGCERITDRGVICVIQKFCFSLHHLYLDGYYLTCESLRRLYRCQNLRTLSVTYATAFDDSCFDNLRDLQYLREIVLRRNKKALSSPVLIEYFSRRACPTNLTHLDFTDCEALNDELLTTLCETGGANLRAFTLAWCCNLTDSCLPPLFSCCPRLVSLNMFGNYAIDGELLLSLGIKKKCPDLLILDFTSCDNVKSSTLEALCQLCPAVFIFNYLGDCVGRENAEISHYNIWKLQFRAIPCSFYERIRERVRANNFNVYLDGFRC